MQTPTLPLKPRVLPFRAALAETGRKHLVEKIATGVTPRPIVHPSPLMSAAPMEEQDSMLNGMTRSLHRRTLGLNFPITGVSTAQKFA